MTALVLGRVDCPTPSECFGLLSCRHCIAWRTAKSKTNKLGQSTGFQFSQFYASQCPSHHSTVLYTVAITTNCRPFIIETTIHKKYKKYQLINRHYTVYLVNIELVFRSHFSLLFLSQFSILTTH